MKRLTTETLFGMPIIIDTNILINQSVQLIPKHYLLPDNWIYMTKEERENWIYNNLEKVKQIESE